MSDNVEATKSRAERYAELERLQEQERLDAEAQRKAEAAAALQQEKESANQREGEILDAVMGAFDTFCVPGVTVDEDVSCVRDNGANFYRLSSGPFEARLQCGGALSFSNDKAVSWRRFGKITQDKNIFDLATARLGEGDANYPAARMSWLFSDNAKGTYADLCGEELPIAGAATNSSSDYQFIPGGTFRMGSDKGYNNEKPVHEVTLSAFAMKTTEVTQKEWTALVLSHPERNLPLKPWLSYGPQFIGDNKPVIGVAWQQAQGYCQADGGDLPSEAQWEYAATGPNHDLEYATSDGSISPSTVNYKNTQGESVWDVGSGNSPNGFGLHDMSGNAWEWVLDRYEDYLPSSSGTDPVNFFTGRLDYPILRGGAWSDGANFARVTYRSFNVASYHNYKVGFRCVRDQP